MQIPLCYCVTLKTTQMPKILPTAERKRDANEKTEPSKKLATKEPMPPPTIIPKNIKDRLFIVSFTVPFV